MQTHIETMPAGTSWLGVTWFQRVAAVAVALAVTMAMASPALAAKGGKGGGGGGGGGGADGSGGAASCTDVLADSHTLSLDEVRAGMNANYAATGGGVGVAVIDTGINQVDGLTGRDKVADGPDLSFDALDDNLRHRDLHGHGTNMAAIIAGNNTASGDGVAPGAHLINVKVGAGDGTVDVSQVIAAIDWVIANRNINGSNIRVISLSYGTDATQDYRLDPLAHAVENAWRHGIVVVVAGGNDGRNVGRLANPALDPYVIAVGATEPDSQSAEGWRVPNWSSKADGVRNPDVVAPGGSVLSTGVAGSYLATAHAEATCEAGQGTLFLRGSGTSQASAAVAGAAAVLLEDRPDLTPDQVKYLLTSTATLLTNDQGDPRPAEQQGYGQVNLAAALAAPSPGVEAIQSHAPSTGLGTLEDARGSFHVGADGDYLDGEMTAFGGDWDPAVWAPASTTGEAWTSQTYIQGDNVWSGGTWSGATWSGATWSGATWSGATWSGATWSGATWSGATWSGATWSGATWSGATWSGATWSGATWSGDSWS